MTTLRIGCPVETAAQRVRSRIARGEGGPSEETIRQIDDVLNRASEIDAVLINDTSIEHFHQQIDTIIQSLESASDSDTPAAAVII